MKFAMEERVKSNFPSKTQMKGSQGGNKLRSSREESSKRIRPTSPECQGISSCHASLILTLQDRCRQDKKEKKQLNNLCNLCNLSSNVRGIYIMHVCPHTITQNLILSSFFNKKLKKPALAF